MKAAHRCSENRQGDRCKKERGHDTFALERDLVHQGSNLRWSAGEPVVELHPVPPQHRRNRAMMKGFRNSYLRFLTANPTDRKKVMDWIDNVVRFLGRKV